MLTREQSQEYAYLMESYRCTRQRLWDSLEKLEFRLAGCAGRMEYDRLRKRIGVVLEELEDVNLAIRLLTPYCTAYAKQGAV